MYTKTYSVGLCQWLTGIRSADIKWVSKDHKDTFGGYNFLESFDVRAGIAVGGSTGVRLDV